MEQVSDLGEMFAEVVMLLPYILSSVAGAGLYGVVMWKAGFRGAVLAVCAAPVVVAVAQNFMIRAGGYGMGEITVLFSLVMICISLSPLLVLALARWPGQDADTTRSGA